MEEIVTHCNSYCLMGDSVQFFDALDVLLIALRLVSLNHRLTVKYQAVFFYLCT